MAFDPLPGTPGPTAFNDDEHWGYTLRKLGGGVVEVELTDAHKKDCLDDTKRWYADRVVFKKYMQLQLTPAMSDYILPDDVIDVLTLWLPNFQLPSLDVDSFSVTYFTAIFGAWASPAQQPMPYSDLVQRLQYLETVGRIFSTDRAWEYWPEQRRLSIMPPPRAGSFGGSLSAYALLEVATSNVDPRLLDPQGHDFFRRKLLIEAKRTLGNIHTIYNSFPTAGGDRAMNGDSLLRQADQEEQQLNKDTMNWVRGNNIIVG